MTASLVLGNQILSLAKTSATAGDTMQNAGQLYAAGQFELAAQGYQQLVDQGYASSALYYNLGNAYMQQGELGRAIVNYWRAQQLTPRDEDIARNLEIARAQVSHQLDIDATGGEYWIDRTAQATQSWLSLNELAVVALLAWTLFALSLIFYTSLRRGGKLREAIQYFLIAISIVLVISAFGLGSRLYYDQTQIKAVVITDEIPVTSGPGNQYSSEFTLSNGSEVNILETRGSWTRLALSNTELQGWVPAQAIERVNL
jgi:tetratricopeptide (TPR) repeat protein